MYKVSMASHVDSTITAIDASEGEKVGDFTSTSHVEVRYSNTQPLKTPPLLPLERRKKERKVDLHGSFAWKVTMESQRHSQSMCYLAMMWWLRWWWLSIRENV